MYKHTYIYVYIYMCASSLEQSSLLLSRPVRNSAVGNTFWKCIKHSGRGDVWSG